MSQLRVPIDAHQWNPETNRERRPNMEEPIAYTEASWDRLRSYPTSPLPPDHPWPTRENLTLRLYSTPLGCEHLAFSIGHLKPGQSVEHHRHDKAEEVYVLIQGHCQIRVGERVIDAKPLDAFRVPAETYRSVYNHTNEDCWWLFMGAPIDEYLENRDYNPPKE